MHPLYGRDEVTESDLQVTAASSAVPLSLMQWWRLGKGSTGSLCPLTTSIVPVLGELVENRPAVQTTPAWEYSAVQDSLGSQNTIVKINTGGGEPILGAARSRMGNWNCVNRESLELLTQKMMNCDRFLKLCSRICQNSLKACSYDCTDLK